MSVSQSWFGPSAVSSCPVPLVLVGHRAQIILDRGARASCHCGPCFFPNRDHQILLDAIRHIVPSATPCHPPHRAIRHTVRSDNASPTSRALSASNPVPEPRLILMRIEQRVRAITPHHLTPTHRPPPPPPSGGWAPPTTGKRASRRACGPDTSPSQGTPRRRAPSREGTTFSRQVRLQQIPCSPPKHLVPLLQQPDPLARLPQLHRLSTRLTGPGTLIDACATHPLLQHHRMNTEVSRDLLNPHPEFTIAHDTHEVVTEPARVELRPSRGRRRPTPDRTPARVELGQGRALLELIPERNPRRGRVWTQQHPSRPTPRASQIRYHLPVQQSPPLNEQSPFEVCGRCISWSVYSLGKRRMAGKLGLRVIPVTSHSQETLTEGTQSPILLTGKLYLLRRRIHLYMDYLHL